MELQTSRLKLIPCTEEFVSTISTEDYKMGGHIQSHLKILKEDPTLTGWGVWFVINKKNNAIIGDIGFKGKPDSENTVEIGYGISPSAQGKGYATEAVQEIIKWAFSFNNVSKVIAECLNDNISSINVLEKLQMTRVEEVDNILKWEVNKHH